MERAAQAKEREALGGAVVGTQSKRGWAEEARKLKCDAPGR